MPLCDELRERGRRSFDAEGAFELGEGGVVGWRRLGAPGVSEDAADDPVGTCDDSVESGVVGVDEQVGEPPVVAAEGECVAVEEDDAGDIVGVGESSGCGYAGAERVADEYGRSSVGGARSLRGVGASGPWCRGHGAGCSRRAAGRARRRGGRGERGAAHVVPDPGRLGGAAEETRSASRRGPSCGMRGASRRPGRTVQGRSRRRPARFRSLPGRTRTPRV